MAKFTKKEAPAPPDNADDSGPSESNPPEATMGGSKSSGKAASYGPGSAARAAQDAGAMSNFVIPLTFGEPSAEPNAASGPSVAHEADVGPDHGNHPELFKAGLPSQTRKAKEV